VQVVPYKGIWWRCPELSESTHPHLTRIIRWLKKDDDLAMAGLIVPACNQTWRIHFTMVVEHELTMAKLSRDDDSMVIHGHFWRRGVLCYIRCCDFICVQHFYVL
jgi:hypothetical protein